MKPADTSWHSYLRGYSMVRWRSPHHEQKYHEILGLLQLRTLVRRWQRP